MAGNNAYNYKPLFCLKMDLAKNCELNVYLYESILLKDTHQSKT